MTSFVVNIWELKSVLWIVFAQVTYLQKHLVAIIVKGLKDNFKLNCYNQMRGPNSHSINALTSFVKSASVVWQMVSVCYWLKISDNAQWMLLWVLQKLYSCLSRRLVKESFFNKATQVSTASVHQPVKKMCCSQTKTIQKVCLKCVLELKIKTPFYLDQYFCGYYWSCTCCWYSVCSQITLHVVN